MGPLGFGNGKPFVGGDKVESGEPVTLVTRSLFEGIIFNSGKLHLLLERLREKDPWKGTFHKVPFYFLLDITLITRYYQHSLLNLTAKLLHLVLGEMDRKSASVTTIWSLMCFLPTSPSTPSPFTVTTSNHNCFSLFWVNQRPVFLLCHRGLQRGNTEKFS